MFVSAVSTWSTIVSCDSVYCSLNLLVLRRRQLVSIERFYQSGSYQAKQIGVLGWVLLARFRTNIFDAKVDDQGVHRAVLGYYPGEL